MEQNNVYINNNTDEKIYNEEHYIEKKESIPTIVWHLIINTFEIQGNIPKLFQSHVKEKTYRSYVCIIISIICSNIEKHIQRCLFIVWRICYLSRAEFYTIRA